MTDSLSHRGPDGYGYEILEKEGTLLGLGHRRLAIIDPTESGAQPMSKHGCTVVYNGEIYNFKDIKYRLAQVGYRFTTDSDTEVLISAYEYWGKDCVEHFQGMFAFVLYDSVKSSVLFCRDRLGVKPLYVYERDGLILFASEIKAFHQHPDFQKAIDKNALGLYLRYGHVPGTSCIFQHTKKIKSGTTVTFNLKRKEHIEHNYWNATEKLLQAPIYEGSEESLYDTLEYKLQEACTYRMVS
ncbi:MAG: asparagine synthetase B, partial [Bacteroidota bacterium]